MFGYVTLYRKGLADAEMDRYQAYYCGLCRTLGRRYGRTGQLALSYDMAFVAILLTALYDTPTAFSEGRCVPHPLNKRPRADNELLDYAADMTAALAYYNFLDDWQDDHRRASLAQAQKLEPSLPALRERWPRQLQTMAAQLDRLNALENAGSHDLDALCNAFGALLGEVFACRDDIWAPALRGMGNGLGAFIYLMDAYDDLEKDSRRGQFNALQQLADELPPAAYEQRCHELLTQQMGRCAQQFEMLPILKDTPEGKLLYNTIYSGVWSKYALVRKHREDPYSVLGITPSADDETIKKAYRKKCKEYHPDLHPDDPSAEEHFKEVQAAYSEIMRIKQGGGASYSAGGQRYGSSQSGYSQQYQDPFSGAGFGFGPFGFGYYSTSGSSGRQSYGSAAGDPELRAAANYIRSGFYEEAMNTLNGIPTANRTAQWHYYAALANQGLGNNIRAQEEARTAVSMEPNNYAYQNLLDQLQSPGRSYTSYQQPYAQPSGSPGSFCLSFWMYLLVCNILSWCCCGGRGGFFIC